LRCFDPDIVSRFNCSTRLDVAVRAAGAQKYLGNLFASSVDCIPLADADRQTLALLAAPSARAAA
jgi:hypothetical protein